MVTSQKLRDGMLHTNSPFTYKFLVFTVSTSTNWFHSATCAEKINIQYKRFFLQLHNFTLFLEITTQFYRLVYFVFVTLHIKDELCFYHLQRLKKSCEVFLFFFYQKYNTAMYNVS